MSVQNPKAIREPEKAKVPDNANPTSCPKWVKIAGCVGAIVLGGGMIALLGGFGIGGVLQNSGLAHLPQWLVNQINTVSHTALLAMSVVGPVAGIITIAISSYFVHNLRHSEEKVSRGNNVDSNEMSTLIDWRIGVPKFIPDNKRDYSDDTYDSALKLIDELDDTYIYVQYGNKTYDIAFKSGNIIYAPTTAMESMPENQFNDLCRLLRLANWKPSKHQEDY